MDRIKQCTAQDLFINIVKHQRVPYEVPLAFDFLKMFRNNKFNSNDKKLHLFGPK